MKKYLSIALLSGALLMSGCGDSNDLNQVSGLQGNPNNNVVAPICVDDTYTTNEDTTLTVNAANGVLANDSPNGGTVVAFDSTSTQNGTVNVNPDGSFTYAPINSFTGADMFTYTVRNNGGQTTCTVTITVQAVNGFFVDAVNGDDTTGSFQGGNPYRTITAAVSDAPTNADIVVTSGNYPESFNLKDGQRLLGSGSTLISAQGATRPQILGPIVLADGNTLDFLRIEGTNGDAVDGIGQDSGTVTNCEFSNITGAGSAAVELDGAFGSWTVNNNTISNTGGTSIFARTTGPSQMTLVVVQNEITNSDLGAVGLISEDTSDVKASIRGNTFRGNNIVTGDAFELIVEDSATVCLDLEDNANDTDSNPGNGEDGVYLLSRSDTGAELDVEELVLGPPPNVPGNTGTFDIDSGAGFSDPTSVNNGDCGF